MGVTVTRATVKGQDLQKINSEATHLVLLNKQWELLSFLDPTIMDQEVKGSFRCQNVVDD